MQFLILEPHYNISWQRNQDGLYYNIAGSEYDYIPLYDYYNPKYNNWFTRWGYGAIASAILYQVFYNFNDREMPRRIDVHPPRRYTNLQWIHEVWG